MLELARLSIPAGTFYEVIAIDVLLPFNRTYLID
jgi:hypothetical protein